MLVAPEVLLDRRADALGRVAVPLLERRLVPGRHRGRRDEPAVGRRGAVGVLPVGLLPEVDARQRKPGLRIHEAAQEVGGGARGGPELAVERRILRARAMPPRTRRRPSRSRRAGGGPSSARATRSSSSAAARALPEPARGRASGAPEPRGRCGPRRGSSARRSRGRAARRIRSRRTARSPDRTRAPRSSRRSGGPSAARGRAASARTGPRRGRHPRRSLPASPSRGRTRHARSRALRGRRSPVGSSRAIASSGVAPKATSDARFSLDPTAQRALDGSTIDDDVLRLAVSVRLTQRRRLLLREQRDGERDPAEVEDERARVGIDVAGAAPLVAVEARRDVHDQALGCCVRIRRTRTGAAGVTTSVISTVSPSSSASRAQHRRAVGVRLLPRPRLVVEPERATVPLDAEAELPEVLPVVDVRPEQPLDLAALADGREQGSVAEDRRRPERVAPSRSVERPRDVGLDAHERSLRVTTAGPRDRAVARPRDRDERHR